MKTMLFFLFCALLLSGCSTPVAQVAAQADKMRIGPLPDKTLTNFSWSLRCMDRTLSTYGVHDLVLISEDIEDKTKKVAAGTKDMLISAISEMSRRSRALHLLVYGNDSSNLIGFVNNQESKSLFEKRAQFGIRGSISQFDENLAKANRGLGLGWGGFMDDDTGAIGFARSASVSVLGLDLSVMSTDLAIVPGVTSNNMVTIMQTSNGGDAEATFSKFGISFKSGMSLTEGKVQALRNLIDLGAIELIGKLTRTPYWLCLGAAADSPLVEDEVETWYLNLSADKTVLWSYWQDQMRLRKLYDLKSDGISNNKLLAAIKEYRIALGLEGNSEVDLEFYRAYLAANHNAVMKKISDQNAQLELSKRQLKKEEKPAKRAVEVKIETVIDAAIFSGDQADKNPKQIIKDDLLMFVKAVQGDNRQHNAK